MSDVPSKSIEQLLMEQLEAQKSVLEATERRVKAETESTQKSQEAIAKHQEAIAAQIAAKQASDRLVASIERLIVDVQSTITIARPIEQVIGKIDILIQILQLLIQIISQLNGVSQEHVDRLREQIYELAKLNAQASKGVTVQQSSTNTGTVDAKQANIAENISAIQKDLENKTK